MTVCKYFQQGYCRFGQNCRFDHIYGSKYSYRAPQTNYSSFDNNTNNPSYNTNNSAASIFRSALQSPPNQSIFSQSPPNQSIFSQSPPNRVSVFDRLGPNQNTYNSNNQNAKSIFSQANQNTFGQTNSNNFFTQNQAQSDAKSLFAQASQNVFGQSQANFSQAKSNPADIFRRGSSAIFGQQNAMSSPAVNGNVFQSSNPSNIFAIANSSFEQVNDDNSIYSKAEDLSKTDMEAFESDHFKLGSVPELPPPKSLCV